MSFIGTSGDDTQVGTAGNDVFNYSQGGHDVLSGLDGDDVFKLGAAFDANDRIDGGTGDDTLSLAGDYSAGVTFKASTVVGIETILLGAGFDYRFTSAKSSVAAGDVMVVDAHALGAGDSLVFDGHKEKHGGFELLAGAGSDSLIGGGVDDSFDLSHGGADTAIGGAGNDTFLLGKTLKATDHIDGGAGAADAVVLEGAKLTFQAATLVGVEDLVLLDSAKYKLTMDDGNVAAGGMLTVDASALVHVLKFNGAAETDGAFSLIGGAANDALTGGEGDDRFDLSHGGKDHLVGGGGDDLFYFAAAMAPGDRVDGGDGSDTVELNGDYTGASALTLGATSLVDVERLNLDAGHSYEIVASDGNVAASATLEIDASGLKAGQSLSFDGSAELDGHFIVDGGMGGDSIIGGHAVDTIDISQGGADTVQGGAGDDLILVGAKLDRHDQIDGGDGNLDIVELDGDYTGARALTVGSMQNVEKLLVDAGHSYDLTVTDASFSSPQVVIDGGLLGVSDSLRVDGSVASSPLLWMIGGAGDDTLTGGARGDFFDLSKGGDDTAEGNFAGDEGDTYYFGAALTAADKVTGTSDFDTIALRGDYSSGVTLSGLQLTGIDDLELATGYSYSFTFTHGVAAGQTLFISGAFLGASDKLTVDMTQETAGFVDFNSGAADDHILISSGAVAGHTTLSGGDGTDTLSLSGDLSAAFTLHMENFETVEIADDSSCTLSLASTTVTSGKVLTIDASALAGSHALSLDASTVDGALSILGGGGDDTIKLGAHFDNDDHVDGGGGFDELVLSGDYSTPLTLSATAVTSVELITLQSGSFDLTLDPDNVAGGGSLTVDGGAVASDKHVTIDGSQIGLASLHLIGGAGDDHLTGGSGLPDTLEGGAGTDHLTGGGGGGDIFGFDSVADSTGAACDMITDADFDADSFHFDLGGGSVAAVDAEVTTGSISLATFDADLAANIGAGQLAAGDAVLFLPDDGDLIGHVYLVVDANGQAGYQAGADYVVDVSNFTGTLDLGDFG